MEIETKEGVIEWNDMKKEGYAGKMVQCKNEGAIGERLSRVEEDLGLWKNEAAVPF